MWTSRKNTALPLLLLLLLLPACIRSTQMSSRQPPADPIADVSAAELRSKGLAFARSGDLTRAQQYLSAAHGKGFAERVVVPEIVKVCLSASRLRAALLFAEPYLERHPEDAGMSYVVGSIHMALGNLQRAAAHLNGALQPHELMIDAAYSLARIAKRQGQWQEASDHLRHYLQVAPKGVYALRAQHMLTSLADVGIGE